MTVRTRVVCMILTAGMIFSLASCVNHDSKKDKTLATLRRVDRVLHACEKSAQPPINNSECVSKFLSENSIDERVYTRDWYGGVIVLDQSSKCSDRKFIAPYSTGPNRKDDCGDGDDFGL